jgi:hypothetical protein
MTQAAIPLEWHTGKLYDVDLDDATFGVAGVYAIGYISRKGNRKTLRAGQSGLLRRRLGKNRDNKKIKAYATCHELDVAWAHVDASDRDGVEAYLGQELDPKLGKRYPEVPPIPVKLPWPRR